MSVYPQPGDSYGDYLVVDELGRGGMGVVYSARQLRLDRLVALKVLSPQHAEDPAFRARFSHEAAVLARLDSPHIVTVHDHGEHEGSLYLVTQRVAGGDLGSALTTHGALSFAETAELGAQLAGALTDAHTAGVVHRDVKPGNVLLRTPLGGATGALEDLHAYLCDFGIAQSESDGATTVGSVVGTWAYLAPERCLGEPAAPASDIYALGCVLWACRTGQAPYGGTETQVAIAHVQSPVPQIEPTEPGDVQLNQILGRAMAKDPAARYATAQELRADLRRAAAEAREQGGAVEIDDATMRRSGFAPPVHDATVRRGSIAPPPVDATVRRGSIAPPPVDDSTVRKPAMITGPPPAGPGVPGPGGMPAVPGASEVPGVPGVPAGPPASVTPAAAVTPAIPISPPAGPAQPAATPGRGRVPTVPLLVGAACLVALLVITTAVVIGVRAIKGPAPPAAADKGQAAASKAAASKAAAPAPEGDAEPSKSPDAPAVTCWNGTRDTVLGNCPPPSGVEGLKWVFPSLASAFSRCRSASASISLGKEIVYECVSRTSRGDEVLLRYSGWVSVVRAEQHYSQDLAGFYEGVRAVGGGAEMKQWRRRNAQDLGERGQYRMAAMYAAAPWSVTVNSDTPEGVDQGLRLLRARPFAQLKGTTG